MPSRRYYHIRTIFGSFVLLNNETNIQVAIDKADVARKSLKSEYNSSFATFDEQIQHEMDQEKEIEQNMYFGLINKEFKLYLQPKYDLNTELIVGAEALVRWVKADGTIIPPGAFISIFEKNGFISDLDMYMLNCVCCLIKDWINQGIPPLKISINQSRRYMYNNGYINTVLGILKKHSVPAELLELEITENYAYQNFAELSSILESLHKEGFMLSIDDFGSGYSSLNVLKELNVDILKLDRIFLSETIVSERGKAIVSNIIRMAKELSLEVVAEGVETSEQVQFLRNSNCDIAQGFYYSKPVPLDEFNSLFIKQLSRNEET